MDSCPKQGSPQIASAQDAGFAGPQVRTRSYFLSFGLNCKDCSNEVKGRLAPFFLPKAFYLSLHQLGPFAILFLAALAAGNLQLHFAFHLLLSTQLFPLPYNLHENSNDPKNQSLGQATIPKVRGLQTAFPAGAIVAFQVPILCLIL